MYVLPYYFLLCVWGDIILYMDILVRYLSLSLCCLFVWVFLTGYLICIVLLLEERSSSTYGYGTASSNIVLCLLDIWESTALNGH
jgi:hypothetical protein